MNAKLALERDRFKSTRLIEIRCSFLIQMLFKVLFRPEETILRIGFETQKMLKKYKKKYFIFN